MRDRRIVIRIASNVMHNEQIIAAAQLWCEKNGCNLCIEHIPDSRYPAVLAILIDGKTIIIDTSDTPLLVSDDKINGAIAYFKRSFIKTTTVTSTVPVYPFGFNYAVVHKPFSITRIRSFKEDKVFLFRSLPILNSFSNMSYALMSYRKMRYAPKDNGGKILMLTRLWDPGRVNVSERKEFRMQMNELRIDTITKLRQAFAGRVICGIEDSYLSRQIKPDYIVSKAMSAKKKYLELLRGSDIGVATSGLEGTLGWRIGEYVAFSKAVVTEPFDVTVPGWNEREHYLVFKDNLVEQIDTLLSGKKYLEMQQANHTYYNEFLEPVNLFSRILKISGIS